MDRGPEARTDKSGSGGVESGHHRTRDLPGRWQASVRVLFRRSRNIQANDQTDRKEIRNTEYRPKLEYRTKASGTGEEYLGEWANGRFGDLAIWRCGADVPLIGGAKT